MNKQVLLEMVSITIAKYELANRDMYINHFGKDEYCCWCVYSKGKTPKQESVYNEPSHWCTACPMLKKETPHYIVNCTNMFTYIGIDPKDKKTWQLRLAFWKMAKRRIEEQTQYGDFFRDLKNITKLLWDIDDELRSDYETFKTNN